MAAADPPSSVSADTGSGRSVAAPLAWRILGKGAWRATVHRVVKSRTQPRKSHFSLSGNIV